MVARGVYKYNFNPNDIRSKWFYASNIQTLPRIWDISQESASLLIMVTELDSNTTYETKDTWEYTVSKNFNWTISAGANRDSTKTSLNFDFGIGQDTGHISKHTVTVMTRRTEASDNLGTGELDFARRIIQKSDKKTINGVLKDGYEVNPLSFGSVSITLIPIDIR